MKNKARCGHPQLSSQPRLQSKTCLKTHIRSVVSTFSLHYLIAHLSVVLKVLLRYKLVAISQRLGLALLVVFYYAWSSGFGTRGGYDMYLQPHYSWESEDPAHPHLQFEASLNYETLSQGINNQAETNRNPEDEPSTLLQQIKARGG